MANTYRTAPDHTLTKMPPGVPFIIGNELAERFSFYGMKGILTVFMTKHLLDSAGQPDFMSDEKAKGVYHLFTAAAYFFPLLGAIIADVFWGKYKTILLISLMYCLGHGCLALMDAGPETGLWDMKPLLFAGLILIAIGAGGIKPCVSANVGDQFGTGNKRLLTQVFNWFYFSINLGAAASNMLTPVLLAKVGPWAAFGLPGVLMGIATIVFWMGRNRFVHVPPSGWSRFKEETFSPGGLRALKNLSPLFLIFVPVFWAIFDQTGSAWVLQAESMDRQFLGVTWLESQVQVVNPLLILVMIPVFTYVVYPAMGKFFAPTPLRKIGIGFVLTAGAFAISALIELAITSKTGGVAPGLWAALGQTGPVPDKLSEIVRLAESIDPKNAASMTDSVKAIAQAAATAGWRPEHLVQHLDPMPNIGWQFVAYFVLTAAEILVSIVCLEFAYTQSPPRMKSFVMGVYLLGVSAGNFVVSGVNFTLDAMKDEAGKTPLEGANYYWFFAGLMGITTVAYLVYSQFYRGQTYIQGEAIPAAGGGAEA
ncbi:MAG: POT family MFS transporter [Phycisphaerales bacterium]